MWRETNREREGEKREVGRERERKREERERGMINKI